MDKQSNKKKNVKKAEQVTNCDRFKEVVANCDHLQSLKFRPTLPYAFTEQGIGQLSTVVHSKIAIERSIMIMNAFVAMRRFMVQNAGILMRIAHLEKHQIETDQKMDMILDRMDKQSPKLLPEQLPQKNHDRFLVIDDDAYLLGASVKDMGVGMCAITKMQVSPEAILQLIK